MRCLGKGRAELFRRQRGFSLLEALVAIGILGFIGVVVVMALDTNSRAGRILDEQTIGANLASIYHETIKKSAYENSYPEYDGVVGSINIPSQFSVGIDADYSEDGDTWIDSYSGNQTLQRIIVSVSHGGKPVLSMCSYRTER
ncbi:prepilin-type N-terminal cleavage/methylation domain-containing protein [Chloroflexota bacterium]